MSDVVSILIPTRGRAEQLKEKIGILRENTTYPVYELTVIVDSDDKETIGIAPKLGIDWIIAGAKSPRSYWVGKINMAFKGSSGKYIACLSDDVETGKDWLGIAVDAFHKRFDDDTGVLCFDDGGEWKNKLAIHPFVSRKWIDRFQYGKWILWPQYWQNYGDSELTFVTKASSRFLWCPDSKVIHTRPKETNDRDDTWWETELNVHPRDWRIFIDRYKEGFPGYGPEKLIGLKDAYIESQGCNSQYRH